MENIVVELQVWREGRLCSGSEMCMYACTGI